MAATGSPKAIGGHLPWGPPSIMVRGREGVTGSLLGGAGGCLRATGQPSGGNGSPSEVTWTTQESCDLPPRCTSYLAVMRRGVCRSLTGRHTWTWGYGKHVDTRAAPAPPEKVGRGRVQEPHKAGVPASSTLEGSEGAWEEVQQLRPLP